MREFVRPACLTILAAALATTPAARAQAPPAAKPAAKPAAPSQATKPAAPAAKPAAAPAVKPPSKGPVVATINGEPLYAGEVLRNLMNYPLPQPEPGHEKEVLTQLYKAGVDVLVNTKLIEQFLASRKVVVPPKEVDDAVEKLRAELKQNGHELNNELAASGNTIDELRKRIEAVAKFDAYVNQQATEPALRKFVDENKDLFNGTQVRASHILVKVPPGDATPEVKEAARQKLASIKKEIDSGKISFADAANKYSEDEGNVDTKAGGDLGFFYRKNMFIDKFAAAAFAMKKGEISDPVETDYGWHLIQVTDRKEGTPVDIAQKKPAVLAAFRNDLNERIVLDMRKTSKIDVQPMPSDFFPPALMNGTASAKAAAPSQPQPKAAAPQPK